MRSLDIIPYQAEMERRGLPRGQYKTLQYIAGVEPKGILRALMHYYRLRKQTHAEMVQSIQQTTRRTDGGIEAAAQRRLWYRLHQGRGLVAD